MRVALIIIVALSLALAACGDGGQGGATADAVAADVGGDAIGVDTAGEDVGDGAAEDALAACEPVEVLVAEGGGAVPGEILHLSPAEILRGVRYCYTVEPPPGGRHAFEDDRPIYTPTFRVTALGTYRFRLDVIRLGEDEPCATSATEVVVGPGGGVLVELSWRTPGAGDATGGGDAVRADLDLHLAHPNARGYDLDGDGVGEGWFDDRWDVYWANLAPNWAAAGAADDPELFADDPDGGGPEVIVFAAPEAERVYRVGVHAWDDRGLGPSVARVRVVVNGVVALDRETELAHHDLWEVCTVSWPSGAVTPLADDAGAALVRHEYWDLLFGL